MKLLGVTDLAIRWNYTKQGVHQKIKRDLTFPKPVAIINKNILVFLEDHVITYEKQRLELTNINHKYYHTHQRQDNPKEGDKEKA